MLPGFSSKGESLYPTIFLVLKAALSSTVRRRQLDTRVFSYVRYQTNKIILQGNTKEIFDKNGWEYHQRMWDYGGLSRFKGLIGVRA